tara:strand:- start:1274 stop:1561 length:288 start_codon:yes stop_codon:yes gene_type:complete
VNRQLLEDLLKFKRIDGVKDVLNDVLSGVFSDEKQAVRWTEVVQKDNSRVLVILGAEDKTFPAQHARTFPAILRPIFWIAMGIWFRWRLHPKSTN